MSHFVKIRTEIKDLAMLDKAARALDLQPVERRQVKGFAGTHQADAVWQVSDRYDVGVVKEKDGTYTLVADWWGTNFAVPDLDKKLLQEYSVQVVLRRARLMGHQVERRQETDGSIKLVVRTR